MRRLPPVRPAGTRRPQASGAEDPARRAARCVVIENTAPRRYRQHELERVGEVEPVACDRRNPEFLIYV